MLYSVRHITTYAYTRTVLSSQHVLRLRPRRTDNQVCTSSEVAMTPGPRRRAGRDDYFGNRMEIVTLEEPHEALTIDAQSVVRVARRRPRDIEMTQPWEQIPDALAMARADAEIEAAQFMFDTARTRAAHDLVAWAGGDFAPGFQIQAVAQAIDDGRGPTDVFALFAEVAPLHVALGGGQLVQGALEQHLHHPVGRGHRQAGFHGHPGVLGDALVLHHGHGNRLQ
jgi:transglutaminase-like putative cysteine protease